MMGEYGEGGREQEPGSVVGEVSLGDDVQGVLEIEGLVFGPVGVEAATPVGAKRIALARARRWAGRVGWIIGTIGIAGAALGIFAVGRAILMPHRMRRFRYW